MTDIGSQSGMKVTSGTVTAPPLVVVAACAPM
jgi:hypothetical protein